MSGNFVWHEEPVAKHHDRNAFDCGVPELNLYLAKFARQNHELGGAKTFVAVRSARASGENLTLESTGATEEQAFEAAFAGSKCQILSTSAVLGFYSISPGAIEFGRVPAKLTKKLGRYDVPVFRLGRLAVDQASQGRGLGGELLIAAGARVLAVAMEVGGVALAIDAKDQRAADWYRRFGALPLLDDPTKLVLPLQVIVDAIAATHGPKPGR